MSLPPIQRKLFSPSRLGACETRPPWAGAYESPQALAQNIFASRAHDLPPSQIEGWVRDAKKGLENALKANPLDIRQHDKKQMKDLQEAYGEAMLELRARKKWQALLHAEEDT